LIRPVNSQQYKFVFFTSIHQCHLPDSSPLDDRLLLANLSEGDETAFNLLFERYRDKLYHYLLKITKSRETAEEIVIDIFVKLWVGRGLMSEVHSLESFLHKIAYNKAIDLLRTMSRHARLREMYSRRAGQQPEQPADEVLIDAESRKLLEKAILSLPPQRRLIYTLSRDEGLTHEQIAAALNLSRNTVKNSIMAAVKSITDFLRLAHPGHKIGVSFFFTCQLLQIF
jgi:RNA polymerase sigma-70 factor (family 1)